MMGVVSECVLTSYLHKPHEDYCVQSYALTSVSKFLPVTDSRLEGLAKAWNTAPRDGRRPRTVARADIGSSIAAPAADRRALGNDAQVLTILAFLNSHDFLSHYFYFVLWFAFEVLVAALDLTTMVSVIMIE